MVVACDMAFELWLATALCSKETKRNQLAHLQVKASAGVVIAKTVVGQPVVDMSAVLRARLPKVTHTVAKTTDLRLGTSLAAVLHRGGLL